MVTESKVIWFDGNFIPWGDAKVHVLTHTLHYGWGVFEGIRCYTGLDKGSAIFRLDDHIQRLFNSAKILNMEIEYSQKDIIDVCLESMRVNGLLEGYLRPIVFVGTGEMGLLVKTNPIHVAVIVWPWGAYLGEEGLSRGIRVKTSSFVRSHVNTAMSKGKIIGDYVNSILAKREVTAMGYDEALMLDPKGFVSEGSGENIFIARGGLLRTPPPTTILEGITRDTVITIAKDEGIEVREEDLTRDLCYTADEAFFTGTAAEITPIRELDDRKIGDETPGKITRILQQRFFDTVHGKVERYKHWLSYL